MKPSIQRILIAIAVLAILMPVTGHAQEASMIGTITDATGGVLPGVTITAVHEDTGNIFTVVTDERGNYQLPLRIGTVTITVEGGEQLQLRTADSEPEHCVSARTMQFGFRFVF